jgi:hypothetical protein
MGLSRVTPIFAGAADLDLLIAGILVHHSGCMQRAACHTTKSNSFLPIIIDTAVEGARLTRPAGNAQRGHMLTIEQKAQLAELADRGQGVKAIEMCIEACEDYLVRKLLERGGFGTLQLSDPEATPRIKFVDPKSTRTVTKARIGGIMVKREEQPGKAHR